MAEADECENIDLCSRVAPQQQLELEDLSILPETEAGPVETGPLVVTASLTLCDIHCLQGTFKPLTNTPPGPGAAPDPGAAPNASQYAVKAMELQTYARSAIEHIIQARESAYHNSQIENTYYLCGEAIKFAVEAAKALVAITSVSDYVAINAFHAATAATAVVIAASTTFGRFKAAATATANPYVAESAPNSGIEAVRTEAAQLLGGVVGRADNAFDIAKQNNNPDYFYAAAAASAAVAAVAIMAGNIEVFNIYYERATSDFSNGTNPITNFDEVLSNTVNDPTNARATTGTDPLTYCFGIMDFIEQSIKQTLLAKYDELLNTLSSSLSNIVPILPGGQHKGFVGITNCGFLSKYTTVIYYAGYIPYNQRDIIERYMVHCHREINDIVTRWVVTGNFTLTCKLETSNLQYDTQKIILCINCGGSHNIIQIPILNVVGFPVFQDVNPLLEILGCVKPQAPLALPVPLCLAVTNTDQTQQFLSLLDIIVRVRICANQGAITALSEPSKEEVTLILSCFQGLIPQGALPASINTITQAMRQILYTEANIKTFSLFCNIFYNFINVSLGFRSLAKIIYSDFFGASDNYGKVIRACKVVNELPIMREHVAFFLTGSNAARVYLALNEIIKLGADITAETIAPILNETFGKLSDNDFMIYLKGQIPKRPSSPWVIDSFDPETGVSQYKNPGTGEVVTFKEENPENYRVFIRMILGGSFYFFKNLFDDTTRSWFTLEMIQSVGIVGYMDHLFAQRFDASAAFLRRCYEKDPTSFLVKILQVMEGTAAGYFQNLDKQINVAHLDGVFKYYNLVTFYTKLLNICGSFQGFTAEQLVIMYDFLINKATSIDCIATVWTLVLNVLYTLFVPENCLARIAVGKFDNDPKNLKLYMGILNDHLTELQTMGYNHPEIGPLVDQQKSIILVCEQGIRNGPSVFKQTCDAWVQKMVTLAVSGPLGQGLFMLSVSDVKEIRGGNSTKLEKALCLAYYPTQQGNICSAVSNGPHIFLQALGNILTNSPIEMDITKSTDSTHEVALRNRLIKMGSQIDVCVRAIDGITIQIHPEGTTQQLSSYLNFLWKHLTTTSNDLKIFFKENLTDIKRVTGIKYIALVLGGYFQIRLLVDDVRDQCREDKHGELESFKTSQEMMACKRGLLPLLIAPPILALIQYIFSLDVSHGINVDPDPVPRILKILGFLFSIKVKSSSPHSPYQLLRLEDSILRFKIDFKADHTKIPFTTEILKPTDVIFFQFLRALGVPEALIKCICSSKYNSKEKVKDLDLTTFTQLNPSGLFLYDAVGGRNNSESNSGRNSVSSLNKHKHKYKHNKLARNNRTHRNKNKRKKNSKSKSHKPKPNSKSKSKSKSKSHKSKSGKSRRKNVTFKRRKRSNRH
jgi:hypothetical protein